MIRQTNLPRAIVFAALCLALSACPDSEQDDFPTPSPKTCGAGEKACGTLCCAAGETCETATSTCKAASSCAAGETACGERCCAAGETCDAATSTCKAASSCAVGEIACGERCCAAGETCDASTSTCSAPVDPQDLERCYAPSSFPANAFASAAAYAVDADGYEYTANHEVDAPYAQMLSVAIWPLSAGTALTGTFDLAQEPFSYAQCERCVLIIAGKSATDQKYYLAKEGTLTVSEVGAARIAGSLSNVRLSEVRIDESSLATTPVEGGCELEIPALSFEYGEPVDDRIAQCFLPETFAADQFRDYVYPYEANDSGWFYRAIEMPSTPATPNLTLFVEVYREGTGSFPLAGAEVSCPACDHFVIIEAQAPSGEMKTYVSAGGTLVLTEMSNEAMVGHLQDVRLVETVISGSQFTPVAGGCETLIPSLDFSSRDAISF